MENTEIMVTVDPAANFEDVARRCAAAGLGNIQTMTSLHLLTGTIALEHVKDLGNVPGVVSVERQRGFQLPPKDSPIQ